MSKNRRVVFAVLMLVSFSFVPAEESGDAPKKSTTSSTTSSGSGSGGGGKFGIGVILFGPTGLSMKYRLDEKQSIDLAVGLFGSFGRLHGNYLYDLVEFATETPLILFVGGGIVIADRKSDSSGGNGKGRGRGLSLGNSGSRSVTSLGIRAPIGLSMYLKDPKLELFAQLGLNVFLTGKRGADVDLGLGIRFYVF